MLRVADIMTREVLTIPSRTSLDDAGTMLAETHIGGAPVMEGGRVVGILSKSDLLDLAPGAGSRRVADAMTPVVFYLRPEQSASAAIAMMLEERIHRVLVLGQDGTIDGIVSATDVLRAVQRGEGDLTMARTSAGEARPAPVIPAEIEKG